MTGMAKIPNVLLLLMMVMTTADGQTIQDTQNLMDALLTGYNRNIRPVEDQSKPVVINVTFNLVSIQGFDEVSETFATIGVVNFEWFDPRMTWDPALYNNSYTISIGLQSVWEPDLILSSPKEYVKVLGERHQWMNVHYEYDGHAYWSPGDVFKSACPVDVTYYPFDVQTCELIFIPWGFSTAEVVLKSTYNEVFLDFFSKNGEWILSGSNTRTFIKSGASSYLVEIIVERRATYFLVNVVLPIICMTFLNVLVFWLPAESGERVSYAVTVLLAISVFLTIVEDNMPKTSEPMSILCYFLIINLIISALVCAAAVFNVNVYFHHRDYTVPRWLDTITRVLNRKKSTKKTPVEDLIVEPLDEETITQKGEQMEVTKNTDKWAEMVGEQTGNEPKKRDINRVNWQEVSCAIDKVFGVIVLLWLVVSSTCLIVMVATRTAFD